ncbi:MAG: hypothetical protein ABL986_19845 [Vicinamibacterales bacterium]
MSPRFLALVLLAGIVPASAQTPSAGTRPAAPAAPAVTAAPPAGGFTYDPQGRRDPFVRLLQRGTDEEVDPFDAIKVYFADEVDDALRGAISAARSMPAR